VICCFAEAESSIDLYASPLVVTQFFGLAACLLENLFSLVGFFRYAEASCVLIVSEISMSAVIPSIEIYTDGGCEPNPGPGGYGVVAENLRIEPCLRQRGRHASERRRTSSAGADDTGEFAIGQPDEGRLVCSGRISEVPPGWSAAVPAAACPMFCIRWKHSGFVGILAAAAGTAALRSC